MNSDDGADNDVVTYECENGIANETKALPHQNNWLIN